MLDQFVARQGEAAMTGEEAVGQAQQPGMIGQAMLATTRPCAERRRSRKVQLD